MLPYETSFDIATSEIFLQVTNKSSQNKDNFYVILLLELIM